MDHIHRTPLPPPLPPARCILADCERTDDLTTVWHGTPTPAVACGFHARYFALTVIVAHNTQLEMTP